MSTSCIFKLQLTQLSNFPRGLPIGQTNPNIWDILIFETFGTQRSMAKCQGSCGLIDLLGSLNYKSLLHCGPLGSFCCSSCSYFLINKALSKGFTYQKQSIWNRKDNFEKCFSKERFLYQRSIRRTLALQACSNKTPSNSIL